MTSAGLKRKKEGKLIGRKPRHPGQRPHLGYRSDDILLGLKRLAEQEGVISARLINDDPNLPSSAAVAHHFGKLSTAYQLVGLALGGEARAIWLTAAEIAAASLRFRRNASRNVKSG
jgi:hypothetical protein